MTKCMAQQMIKQFTKRQNSAIYALPHYEASFASWSKFLQLQFSLIII